MSNCQRFEYFNVRLPRLPFVDHVARCRIAAHHTHVGKRSAHLKHQERTVAICISHRPRLFTERCFHHGVDLNAQVATYNVTSNRLGPGLWRTRKSSFGNFHMDGFAVNRELEVKSLSTAKRIHPSLPVLPYWVFSDWAPRVFPGTPHQRQSYLE